MKRINKKKVSMAIILVVIIVSIVISLVIYNSRRQEDLSIQREEQNTQDQGDEENLGNARIKLTVNGNEEVFVSLDNNQASQDFLEMLNCNIAKRIKYRWTTFWLYSKNRRFCILCSLGKYISIL